MGNKFGKKKKKTITDEGGAVAQDGAGDKVDEKIAPLASDEATDSQPENAENKESENPESTEKSENAEKSATDEKPDTENAENKKPESDEKTETKTDDKTGDKNDEPVAPSEAQVPASPSPAAVPETTDTTSPESTKAPECEAATDEPTEKPIEKPTTETNEAEPEVVDNCTADTVPEAEVVSQVPEQLNEPEPTINEAEISNEPDIKSVPEPIICEQECTVESENMDTPKPSEIETVTNGIENDTSLNESENVPETVTENNTDECTPNEPNCADESLVSEDSTANQSSTSPEAANENDEDADLPPPPPPPMEDTPLINDMKVNGETHEEDISNGPVVNGIEDVESSKITTKAVIADGEVVACEHL